MVNLMNIARGVGMPLKFDQRMQRYGPYVWVQVDVDCSVDLPERVLVQRRKVGFDLFVNIIYEFVLYFYHGCKTIGNKIEACMRTMARTKHVKNNSRLNKENTSRKEVRVENYGVNVTITST